VITAQEQLRALLREDVAPALRALGLTGTERTFRLPSRTHFAQIGIQSSTSSLWDLVRFTANVSVIDRDSWDAAKRTEAWLPKQPSPNGRYSVRGLAQWKQRAPKLASGSDDWWEIGHHGHERERVAASVIDILTRYALPAIRERLPRT